MIARRRALLVAALAAVRINEWQSVRELVMLHAWLDTWSGLGTIVVGRRRHGYDLSLTHDRKRLAGDVPPPESRPVPMGRSGAPLVADAVAGSARGGR